MSGELRKLKRKGNESACGTVCRRSRLAYLHDLCGFESAHCAFIRPSSPLMTSAQALRYMLHTHMCPHRTKAHTGLASKHTTHSALGFGCLPTCPSPCPGASISSPGPFSTCHAASQPNDCKCWRVRLCTSGTVPHRSPAVHSIFRKIHAILCTAR